jgi:hypothetical protein
MTEVTNQPGVCVLTTIVIQVDTDWVERSRSGGLPLRNQTHADRAGDL